MLENLSGSGQWIYVMIAIAAVALILLIACLRLLSKLVAGMNAASAKAEPLAAYPAVEAIERGIDPAVVAAIAAAVSAMSATGKTLVVRSIKKSAAWQRAAREEQLNRF